MKIVLFILLMLCAPAFAEAGKAVVVVTGSTAQNLTTAFVNVTVSSTDNSELNFSTSIILNFASSPNQTNADIKQRVRDILQSSFGISIAVTDIILFGGAQ